MERFTVTELYLMRDLLIEKWKGEVLIYDNDTYYSMVRMLDVINEEILDRKCDENE